MWDEGVERRRDDILREMGKWRNEREKERERKADGEMMGREK